MNIAIVLRRLPVAYWIFHAVLWTCCGAAGAMAQTPNSLDNAMTALAEMKRDGAISQAEYVARLRELLQRYSTAQRQSQADAAPVAPVAAPAPAPSNGFAREMAALSAQRAEGSISVDEFMQQRRELVERYQSTATQPDAGATVVEEAQPQPRAAAMTRLPAAESVRSAPQVRSNGGYASSAVPVQEPATELETAPSRSQVRPLQQRSVQFYARPSLVVGILRGDLTSGTGGALAVGLEFQRTHDVELEAGEFHPGSHFAGQSWNFVPVLATYNYNFRWGDLDLKVGASIGATFEKFSSSYFYWYNQSGTGFSVGPRVGFDYSFGSQASFEIAATGLYVSQTNLLTGGGMALIHAGVQFRF